MSKSRNSILGILLALFVAQSAIADPDPLLVSQGRIDALAELVGQARVDRTMERITTHYDFEGRGSWGFEWRRVGERIERRADKLKEDGRHARALEKYTDA